MVRRQIGAARSMKSKRGNRRAMWGVLIGLCGAPAGAAAGDDKALAQALFDEAMKLGELKQYAEACPKLAESQRLDPQTGTLFWLADCQEHTGKLASAWANFIEAADAAAKAGRKAHADQAQARADALKARLTRIIIAVPPEMMSAPGLRIMRDGAEVGDGQFGTPLPIDVGKHTIRAAAAGKRPWETTIEAAGEGNIVSVTVPILQDDPEIQVVAPGQVPWNGKHTAGLITIGVGLVGFGVASALGADAISKHDASKAQCPTRTNCPQSAVDLEDSARGPATASTMAFVGSGVTVAAGAALFLISGWPTGPKSAPPAKPGEKDAASPRWLAPQIRGIHLAASPEGAFLSVQGAF